MNNLTIIEFRLHEDCKPPNCRPGTFWSGHQPRAEALQSQIIVDLLY